jgi:hypothetical protein
MRDGLVDPQPNLRIDGRAVRSTTRINAAGGYVVTIATGIDPLGLELQSTYVGHEQAETHVTHLLLARGVHEVEHRVAAHDLLPVMYTRRHLLYDHLVRLQDFADELGIGALHADVLDATLRAIEA